MPETFSRWEPVEGVAFPCAAVEISNAGGQLTMRLEFSNVDGGGERDLVLRLRWGCVVSFATWSEFAHPWNDETAFDRLPKLGAGAWPTYAFPLLEVFDSHLTATLGTRRAAFGAIRHFRIVTLDHTVDLLATTEPEAEWVSPIGGETAP